METTSLGLTTTRAPFIEQARLRGDLYIPHPYELYSEENHRAWRELYRRIMPRWERYAPPKFLEGVKSLALNPDRIPHCDEINKFLAPLTGFKAKPVSGYVPAYLFFDCLRRREFPTTITIRSLDSLDYLPEPDIFHDVAGHVPMHTDQQFADVLVKFGEVARSAAIHAKEIKNKEEQLRTVESIIKAMARFFWFTIEFGLMDNGKGIQVYGSGLLSSFSELQHAAESPLVQRYPFQLEWAVNQCFEIDHFQPLLFTVRSFEHLFEEISRLEKWILQGKLNNVAPGEPGINEVDLQSFISATV